MGAKCRRGFTTRELGCENNEQERRNGWRYPDVAEDNEHEQIDGVFRHNICGPTLYPRRSATDTAIGNLHLGTASNSFSQRYLTDIGGRFMRIHGPSVRYRARTIGYRPPLLPMFGLTIALSRARARGWPVCKFPKRWYYALKKRGFQNDRGCTWTEEGRCLWTIPVFIISASAPPQMRNQMALFAGFLIMRILFAFERLSASLKAIFLYGLINCCVLS